MEQNIKIAIFGLNLNILNQMKNQLLLAVPKGVNIQWVNLTEQKIDLLLVNDMFYSSNNIQRIIKNNTHVYLRLMKEEAHAGVVVGDKLAYPFTQLESLTEWLQQQFFDYMDESLAIGNVPSFNMEISRVDTEYVFNEIFISRNGFIQLLDSKGFIALIDTMNERVWFQDIGYNITFNETLNHTYATTQFVQEFTKNLKAQDLRIWLWKILNHSNQLNLPSFKDTKYFKLKVWPQFEKGFERRNLLKVAACFSKGAKITDVTEALSISNEIVEKFISISILLRLGHFIDESEAQFSLTQYRSDSGNMQTIRGFFDRVRKKLGI